MWGSLSEIANRICDVEIGHRSATVCHLGYQLRHTLVSTAKGRDASRP